MKKFKLFCFPFAGGSSTSYNFLKKLLEPDIQVIPIELPGHGRRFNEPLLDSIDEMSEDAYHQLSEELGDTPFAFFGHSMGTLIAYQVSQKLQRRAKPLPEILFMSGRKPPFLSVDRVRYRLENEELLKELSIMGGITQEFLDSEELMALFLPIIRTDLKAVETYDYTEEKTIFDIKIHVLNGIDDPYTDINSMALWKLYSSKSCEVHNFPGGHFFIHEQPNNFKEFFNGLIFQQV